jgi:fructoselysine-6-P-deglycase FrlB-like protein
MEQAIMDQPALLTGFSKHDTERAPSGSIFVGAGDSYLAASIANRIGSMRYIVLDPYELLSAPEMARGRTVYFVSVSGKTTSNLAASKAVARLADRRVAVTANASSELVRTTDSSILLPYHYVSRQPGLVSFSLSAVALAKLAVDQFSCDFRSAISEAKLSFGKIRFTGAGTNHFLGNGALYEVCRYAVLKSYELTGEDAQATMLEEFGHSTVFGLKKGDVINIFGNFDPAGLSGKLRTLLEERGFWTSVIHLRGSDTMHLIFSYIFSVQLAILRRGMAIGLTRPHFVHAKEVLSVSDSLIY